MQHGFRSTICRVKPLSFWSSTLKLNRGILPHSGHGYAALASFVRCALVASRLMLIPFVVAPLTITEQGDLDDQRRLQGHQKGDYCKSPAYLRLSERRSILINIEQKAKLITRLNVNFYGRYNPLIY